LKQAEASFDLLDKVFEATAAIKAAEGDYGPLQHRVRKTQSEIASLTAELKVEQQDLDRQRRQIGEADPGVKALADDVERIEREIAAHQAEIPKEWAAVQKEFAKLLSNEKRAQLQYRRAVDEAYMGIVELLQVIEDADAVRLMDGRVADVQAGFGSQSPEALTDALKDLETAFGRIAGASDVRSAFAKVRRNLRPGSADLDKARATFAAALAAYEAEVAWRQSAKQSLL
ncbi:MAG: hypothetical protein VW405_11490, partial [Rhodospirillaceae bacterium]